jgi:hypothetical protein
VEPPAKFGLVDWLLSMLMIAVASWGATQTGALLGYVRWGTRWGLAAVIGGLLTYIYLVLELPGGSTALESPGHIGVFVLVLLGSIVGWGISIVLRFLGKNNAEK